MPPALYPVAPTSEPFRIMPSVYFRHALVGTRMRGVIIIPLIIVAGLVTAALALGDIRFLLTALIVCFIAVPMVMAIVYFYIVMSPEATRSTLPHTILLSPDGSLHIRYIKPSDDEQPHHTPAPETIPRGEIVSCRVSSSHIIYRLKSGCLVIVPIEVLNLDKNWACQFRDFD